MKSLIQTHLFPELSDGKDSDWYKDSSDEDKITMKKDDFVIVEYEGSHFPGKIVQVVTDGYDSHNG